MNEKYVEGSTFVHKNINRKLEAAVSVVKNPNRFESERRATPTELDGTIGKLQNFKHLTKRRANKILSKGRLISKQIGKHYLGILKKRRDKRTNFAELSKNDSKQQQKYRKLLMRRNIRKKLLMEFLKHAKVRYRTNENKISLVQKVMEKFPTFSYFLEKGVEYGLLKSKEVDDESSDSSDGEES